MTASSPTAPALRADRADRADDASALILSLAHAENALDAFTSGQVDAIIAPDGATYLMRPAQEHLRRSEARLNALFESSADLITVVGRGGLILSQNQAVKRLLGYEPSHLVGKFLFHFVHDEDLPPVCASFYNVIKGFSTDAAVEFRHRTSDGSWRLLEATISKLRDLSVASVVLTCRDATERRSAQDEAARREAALTAASQAKDRLFATLSHELRTPLAPALLGVQALEEDARFVEAAPTLAMIRRNIEMQARLIEKLLDYTHIIHGKVRPKLESIDAHAALRNVIEMCQSEITARQIDLRLDLDAEEHHVRAGSTELQQILLNLVRNAVKFSEPGGAIEISSAADAQSHLSLTIADHGIGIEAGLLPRVFDSFQQGDPAVQQRYGGLGLGLFIAKSLAEAQQGILTAASEGPGKGATFRLTLDLAPPVEAPPTPPVSLPPESLSILLVEDHTDTRVALVRLLELRGHTVFAAKDSISALEIAATCDFELLISDISLPDGTGHELMERLRLTQPELKGIAMSGFGMPSDIARSHEAGFFQHLVKPVTRDSLQSAIHAVADERSITARASCAS